MRAPAWFKMLAFLALLAKASPIQRTICPQTCKHHHHHLPHVQTEEFLPISPNADVHDSYFPPRLRGGGESLSRGPTSNEAPRSSLTMLQPKEMQNTVMSMLKGQLTEELRGMGLNGKGGVRELKTRLLEALQREVGSKRLLAEQNTPSGPNEHGLHQAKKLKETSVKSPANSRVTVSPLKAATMAPFLKNKNKGVMYSKGARVEKVKKIKFATESDVIYEEFPTLAEACQFADVRP
jgi:hypothetical protein